MDLTTLLKTTIEKRASDLHLSTGEVPIVRIDGELEKLEGGVLEKEVILNMLSGVMTEAQRKILAEDLEIDFGFSLEGLARFRINAYHQQRGVSAAFRVIPFEVPNFNALDMSDAIFKELCTYPNGLVLMSGPTGSGKSTTLAGMINHINHTRSHHIVTVEDPIEFLFESECCLVHQREVGKDTNSFNAALRSALREDPDVIMVGEMRDLETIRLALTAAETGHLVFATVHTNSAAKSVDRIIDAFPGGEKDMIRAMLAESLRAVVAQRLLRRPGGGRIGVQEIMVCTGAIRNLIRENKVPQIYSAIQSGREFGMRTMEQHTQELLAAGKIESEDGKSSVV